MQHRSVVVLAFLILSLVTTGTLQAKPADPVPKGKVPFIQEAQVDFDVAVECPDSGTIASDTLTITGIGLGLSGGPSPVITLGTYPPLTVCVFDEELVLAELPTDTEDGDYLLSVITSDGVGTFDMTVGATGPEGPAGPAGADGEDGANGPAGIGGINCWDTNANGTNDPEEDVQPDGFWDVLDCKGAKGDNGSRGLPGSDGASCSLTECVSPGEATLTCGATSVTVPCTWYFAIGDRGPAGGIVFFVTDGGLHGLEAAPVDQSSGRWGCSGDTLPGADGLTIGLGAQNTADIIAGCPDAGIAARIADSYHLGNFNDWFLPSRDELNALYLQRDVVGGFANAYYWSSSEGDAVNAWSKFFTDGSQSGEYKFVSIRVRAIRAF